MELRQEKKTGTLKYILLCVFAGLILAVGAAIRTVYGGDVVVAYEHDKLYHEFKKTYEIKNIDIEVSEDKYGTVLVENDNFTAKYHCDEDGDISFSIVDKNSGECYGSRSELYGVDSAGNIVCTYPVVYGKQYYDPYSKEYEYGIRIVDYNEEKIVIEVLLLQDFFWVTPYRKYAKFMTVEDYETFWTSLDADNQKIFKNLYHLTTSEELSYSDYDELFGIDNEGIPGLDLEKFSEPFYLSVSLSKILNRQLEEAGYTIVDRRMQELKFFKKDYEAPMALARFTVDISGEELAYDAELVKVISPKNSDVVDILVPEDPQIAIENRQLVKEGVSERRTQNYDNVIDNVDKNYAEYPVDFELTLGEGKVYCELFLNEGYGFGDMNIRIFEESDYGKVFYGGTIAEGEPLNIELLEAKYSSTKYTILLYNENYIYEWQLAVKLSDSDSVSVSKKNIFYNEIGEVSFEAYSQFTDKQLADYDKYPDSNNVWDKSSDYDYKEAVSPEVRQNLYEGRDAWILKYFRSDSPDARYLIEVRYKVSDRLNPETDPCILSREVCGDAILEPFFTEYGLEYYLTITRLDDGAPAPYALFGYRLY